MPRKKKTEAEGTERQKAEPLANSSLTNQIKEEAPSEQQLKGENKTLKKIIFVMVGLVVMFLVVYLAIVSLGKFQVDGVKFQIVKEGELILYKTTIPVLINNKTSADYQFYLRTDPRLLKEKVPLEGDVIFRKNLVLDVTTDNLFCGGDWTIALVNAENLYKLLGFNILVKNESNTYQPENQYMFVTINQGNQTEIRELAGNSYEMNISSCEVLPAFERLMLEAFIKRQELN